MKRRARAVSALLAALLACYALCACGAPEPPDEDLSEASDSASERATDAEDERLEDCLPENLHYGNREIVILSRYLEGWSSGEISVPELTNEPVNDAVYYRNKTVEERLKIRIHNVEEHCYDPYFVTQAVSKAVAGGASGDYHLAAASCFTAVDESLKGSFADLRASQYLDFEKPWWSQGFNEVVEYHGAQYEATGAALLSMYRFAFATIFNKRLFEQRSAPFLYDAVNQGKWTIDYQTSLLDQFHTDNGNGQQDEQGDTYGLVTGCYLLTDPYWSSCRIPIVGKNEDGDYEFVFDVNRLHETAEKLMRMYYQTDGAAYIYPLEGNDGEPSNVRNLFADGYAAMATIRLLETEKGELRGMKDEFGIVPMPKFDEQQDGYRTLMHDQFTVLFAPTYMRGQDLDMVGAVLEALASDSYYRVKPAYYELTLRTKIARDPESALMLDVVMDNIYIDAGIIYTIQLGTFHDNFRQIMSKGKNTVISTFKTVSVSTEKCLKSMNRRLQRVAARAARRS